MKLKDRRFFILFTLFAFLLFGANAGIHASVQQRQQAQSKCPVTKVSCPDSIFKSEKLQITADVSGGDPQVTPTYNWTVSAGSISSGQGTSTIEVDTTEVAADSSVTATVDVGGFARECGYGSTAASCTTSVMKKAEARKLDEYGKLAQKDENARLDNFMIEINMDPTAQSYIIAYAGRAGRAGDAQKAADKAKDYLVKTRGLDASRVVSVNGGHREQPAIELWIVPTGAQPPQPTPTVKPAEAKPSSPAKPKPTTRKKG
jgi:hypothetical protein